MRLTLLARRTPQQQDAGGAVDGDLEMRAGRPNLASESAPRPRPIPGWRLNANDGERGPWHDLRGSALLHERRRSSWTPVMPPRPLPTPERAWPSRAPVVPELTSRIEPSARQEIRHAH